MKRTKQNVSWVEAKFHCVMLASLLLGGACQAQTQVLGERFVGPELTLTEKLTQTSRGPVRLLVLHVSHRLWKLQVQPANPNLLKRTAVSTIELDYNRSHNLEDAAVAAVNGGFFAYEGAAVGALKIDNRWLRLPWKNRTAIVFKKDGSAEIGSLSGLAWLETRRGPRVQVDVLHGRPSRDLLCTLEPGTEYELKPGEVAVQVKDGRIVSVQEAGRARTQRAEVTIIAGAGARERVNDLRVGDEANLLVTTVPRDWGERPMILGAGPRLVAAGKLQVTAAEEEFRPDVLAAGPRTAIGIQKNGDFLIVVADGRQETSVGLTLPELADVMLREGAEDALNLDGGSSTTMVVRDLVVNKPSRGAETPVSNAVLVVPKY